MRGPLGAGSLRVAAARLRAAARGFLRFCAKAAAFINRAIMTTPHTFRIA